MGYGLEELFLLCEALIDGSGHFVDVFGEESEGVESIVVASCGVVAFGDGEACLFDALDSENDRGDDDEGGEGQDEADECGGQDDGGCGDDGQDGGIASCDGDERGVCDGDDEKRGTLGDVAFEGVRACDAVDVADEHPCGNLGLGRSEMIVLFGGWVEGVVSRDGFVEFVVDDFFWGIGLSV